GGPRPSPPPLGEDGGTAANSGRAAGTGQNGCSRGLPSGRMLAKYATANHGAPAGLGSPRCNAVMPGHSIHATAAMRGAADSNSLHVATAANPARPRALQADQPPGC